MLSEGTQESPDAQALLGEQSGFKYPHLCLKQKTDGKFELSGCQGPETENANTCTHQGLVFLLKSDNSFQNGESAASVTCLLFLEPPRKEPQLV